MSNATLDGQTAWQLLRQACEPQRSGHPPARLHAAGHPELALTVAADGDWRAACSLTPDAAWLLDLYLPLCRTSPRELVVAQMGQSVDGRVATASGASHYVTGEDDLTHLHRLRALSDAVVVGARTVLADDPQLTVRRVEGRNPVRVVLDPAARLPSYLGLFRDGQAPTLRLYDPRRGTPPAREGLSGVENVPVLGGPHGMSPGVILETLAGRGLRRVLVEGGGETVSRFLAAGALDRLFVSVAPMIIGSGRRSFRLPEIERLDQALRPPCRRFLLGEDVLFDFCLSASRAPAGEPSAPAISDAMAP